MDKKKLFRKISDTRAPNQQYIFSYEELSEYAKCYNSFEYFIEFLYKDNSLILPYHKEIINHYLSYRFRIEMSSRQMGTRNIMSALYLWQLIFNANYKIIIIGMSRDSVDVFYNNILHWYKNTPYAIQPGLVTLSQGKKIEFDNGSLIEFTVYSKYVTISKNYSNYIFIDAAQYSKFETLYKSLVPSIVARKDTKITIKSTPNGHNFFYDLVINSDRPEDDPTKNIFKCQRNYWWKVPGRDEQWRQQMIKALGSEELFDREYNMFIRSK